MSSPDAPTEWASSFTPNLDDFLSMVDVSGSNPTVVIDGPSGAGKSTVADFLVAHWPEGEGEGEPVQLVRLDDIYPGWTGLEAAATIAANILAARSRGQASSWQRYDWASATLTTWHEVDPHRPLIIEGCGSLGRQAQETADVRIWVSAAEGIRRDRALSRGGEDFESHWDAWDQQYAARMARENPKRFANIILAAN